VQAKIMVYLNNKQELCVPITESGASIGRDPGNVVQLPMPAVSKQHAMVRLTPIGWQVRDLKSRNGLYVNDQKVGESLLKSGDCITIGPYSLIFEVVDAATGFTPRLQIDLSEETEQQTMVMPRPKFER
jgi:pSer/pThr/pTyr-binding forkhead associated (FHA) protein